MTQTQAKKTLELTCSALDDLKAQNIIILEVGSFTSVTDYMVIASGTSTQHVRSIANNLEKTAKQRKADVFGIEGSNNAEWVLVDLGDVIAHIMLPDVRDYYQLEKLWSVEDIVDTSA